MNNIEINNIRPINKNNAISDNNLSGAYISYSAVLNGKEHRITGNFLASDREVNNASTNHDNWDGFKELVLGRLKNDMNILENAK